MIAANQRSARGVVSEEQLSSVLKKLHHLLILINIGP